MDHLPGTHFFTLVTDSNEDTRQNQYVALLEQQPQTEEQALKLLSSIHHIDEWNNRQFHRIHAPLNYEAPDKEDERERTRPIGNLESELELLPEEDRNIIQRHVLDGLTVRELSIELGISKSTAGRRIQNSLKNYRELLQ